MKMKKSRLKQIVKEEILYARKQYKLKEGLRKNINNILREILSEVSAGASSFVKTADSRASKKSQELKKTLSQKKTAKKKSTARVATASSAVKQSLAQKTTADAAYKSAADLEIRAGKKVEDATNEKTKAQSMVAKLETELKSLGKEPDRYAWIKYTLKAKSVPYAIFLERQGLKNGPVAVRQYQEKFTTPSKVTGNTLPKPAPGDWSVGPDKELKVADTNPAWTDYNKKASVVNTDLTRARDIETKAIANLTQVKKDADAIISDAAKAKVEAEKWKDKWQSDRDEEAAAQSEDEAAADEESTAQSDLEGQEAEDETTSVEPDTPAAPGGQTSSGGRKSSGKRGKGKKGKKKKKKNEAMESIKKVINEFEDIKKYY